MTDTARVWEALDDQGRVVWSGSVNDDGHLVIELPERARKARRIDSLRTEGTTLVLPPRDLLPGDRLYVAPPTRLAKGQVAPEE